MVYVYRFFLAYYRPIAGMGIIRENANFREIEITFQRKLKPVRGKKKVGNKKKRSTALLRTLPASCRQGASHVPHASVSRRKTTVPSAGTTPTRMRIDECSYQRKHGVVWSENCEPWSNF